MDKDEGSENEGAGGTAEPEPTDADLLQILTSGNPAPANAGRKSSKANKASDEDADIEADEDEDLDNDGESDTDSSNGKKRKAKAAAASDLQDDEDDAGDEDEGDKRKEGEESDDDEPADDAAGEDDPDAALDDEDKKVRAKFTPEQQERFDRAVSKKTRRILELKTELSEEQAERERLAGENEELRKGGSPTIVASADNPLAGIEDETKLDARLTDARKLRRFALANPDGAYVDKKTGEVVQVEDPENPPEGLVAFSKKRIGEILADTEEMLQEHGPKHRKFLQDRARADAAAVQEFPWLKNKTSNGYIAVEATLREAPQLSSVPGIKLLLADAFVGRHVRMTEKQRQQQQRKNVAGKNGDGKERKAPPSPGRGTQPAKISGKQKVTLGAATTLARTGDDPGDAALRAILKS